MQRLSIQHAQVYSDMRISHGREYAIGMSQ
jgi:hypothetical protein